MKPLKLNPYEKLVPPKIHYAVFWFSLGILFVVVQEVILGIFRANSYFATRWILIIFGTSGQVISLIAMSYLFHSTLSELTEILDKNKFRESWADEETRRMFSFRPRVSRVMPVIFIFLGNITLFVLESLPYKDTVLNVMWVILWQPAFFVSGHSAGIIIETIKFLYKVGKFPFVVPFYRGKHPAIMSLWTYCTRASFIVLLYYAALILVFWQSPFGLSRQAWLWIIATSFFPLLMVIMSFAQIHKILHGIKEAHIEVVNRQIQAALKTLTRTPSKETAKALSNFMGLQREVEKYPDWPFGFEGGLTFLLSLILPVIQIVSYLIENSKTP